MTDRRLISQSYSYPWPSHAIKTKLPVSPSPGAIGGGQQKCLLNHHHKLLQSFPRSVQVRQRVSRIVGECRGCSHSQIWIPFLDRRFCCSAATKVRFPGVSRHLIIVFLCRSKPPLPKDRSYSSTLLPSVLVWKGLWCDATINLVSELFGPDCRVDGQMNCHHHREFARLKTAAIHSSNSLWPRAATLILF